MAVARFTLAVDRRKRDGQQSADFIPCVSFGRQGEFIEKYVKKGTKIVVEGHIQTSSYTNREGSKVYTTEVISDSVEFAESKNRAQGNEEPQPSCDADGFMQIPAGIQEELPFD
jgi:single-strand DNA-binding protein